MKLSVPLLPPVKTAWIACGPAVRVDRVTAKVEDKPLPLPALEVAPNDVVPSKNSTVPTGLVVPPAEGVTVAVKVTLFP